MKNKNGKFFFIFILVVTLTLLILWLTGLIGLWTEGISYIANNTKEFSDKKGYIVHEEYSISIDLLDLESNLGKELYNDGIHRIYVAHIDNTGSFSTGGYRIGFRSNGTYSLNGASLISGIHHATADENSFTSSMSAKMTAEYNGKIYNSNEFGTSGLNYKNGDDFAFYIFPPEAYKSEEVSLDENGIVNLTVTDLFKNIWVKK